MLHDIKMLFPILAQYVNNYYRFPARLFSIGGKEIKSKECSTQGGSARTSIYGIDLTSLLTIMLETIMEVIMVDFADDITAARICEMLRSWWNRLIESAPSFAYYPQPTHRKATI